ncbi:MULTISPECIES: TRAP transporter small permease subunit [unclassified Roseibium]|uniref:TRAP transporter small permease n=1 Tax=unclassified Roseibium TaxID=2629323 RepID=UPI00317F14F5
MSSPFSRLEQGAGRIAGLFAAVGGAALFVLALVTIVSVFWRYVLRDPIFGIEDISTMALSVAVAGAVAYGAHKGAHVSVNVIAMIAGRRVTRVTDAAARVLNTGILGLAAYALFKKGSCGIACGAMTSNLGLLHQPFYYGLVAAMAFYALVQVLHLCIGLAHWAGDDPNEIAD